ncbi:MAG: putative long-chain-fatty-acid--CoA ligase [Jatrophihabitans sp.]|nr:putative long-chain-fatty-acid--CoA ligase [Jatrophihabitans sp.]
MAVVCEGDSLTYAELDERVDAVAAMLAMAGVVPGDRVVWLGQNCHRWLEILVAAGRIGATLCSLSWRQPAAELGQITADLAPRVIVWQERELKELVDAVAPQALGAEWIQHDGVGPDGYEARVHAAAGASRPAHVENPDDPVLAMVVASATNDNPVALLSHRNLLIPALVLGPLQHIDASTVNLASAPLFHIAALFSILPTFQFRGTNVMVGRPDPERLCAAVEQYRCTHAYLVRPTAEAMLAIARERPVDLSSLRSNLDLPGWTDLVARDDSPWGRRTGGYGQTETNMAVLSALGRADASSTSGCAAPYAEVRIVDAAERECGVDELGEIVVRGPSVHRGYWNRPALNMHRFRGGWWHTGDLGRRDRDGSISFVSPMGRMLKSGAENIYATEVERCLSEHAAVAEAAVLGIPDEVWIQRVMAVIVLADGVVAGPELEAELTAHCRVRLAPYKIARQFHFQHVSLPRAGSEIDYDELDRVHGGGNYPGAGTRST